MARRKRQFLSSLAFFALACSISLVFPVLYPELRAFYSRPEQELPRIYFRVPVLCFHDLDGKGPYSVSRHEFRSYMEKIKEAGVQVISLRELYDAATENKLLTRPSLVITIDDDYTNIVRLAAPILREYSYPATFYVYIKDIKGSPEEGMSWEDLNRIAGEGFDIQNHSFSHTKLSKPYPGENSERYRNRIIKEIILSGKVLKERVPSFDRFSFAYPMGYHNPQIADMLKKEGYRVLVTTDSIPLDLRKPFTGTVHRYTIQKMFVRDPQAMFELQLKYAREIDPLQLTRRH